LRVVPSGASPRPRYARAGAYSARCRLEQRRAYSRADEEVATAVGALLALRLTCPSAR
jgi:hypothetical protein